MKRSALLLILFVCGSAHAQYATVQFATDALSVQEGQTGVTLGVQVDGPGNFGGVGIQTQDGTATATEDYTSISTFLFWEGSDSSEKFLTIQTVDDGPGEGDETFTVAMVSEDGLTIGSPSSVEVTITEGGGVTARFVLPDGIPANPLGDYWIPVAGGQDLPVLLRLSEVPATAVTVNYLVGDDPTVHSVEFDDIQERTVVIASPEQPANGQLASQHIRIVDTPSAKRELEYDEFLAAHFWAIESTEECVSCALHVVLALLGYVDCEFFCSLSFGYSCDSAKLASPSMIPTLRRYRDEILTPTTGGNYFSELYTELSGELIGAIFKRPRTLYDIWQASGAWIAAFDDLLDGTGAMTVTPAMEVDLIAIVNQLRADGSANLDSRLDEELTRLLDGGSLNGMSIADFQQRVEESGASVSVEETSWGGLKARFGN